MVIAKKTKDGVLVGYSAASSYVDMTARDILLDENQPFWRVDGTEDTYVCASCASRTVDILRYNDEIFKSAKNGVSIVKDVVPKMKALLSENDALINNGETDVGILIIKGNRIFKVSQYFVVNEADDFADMLSSSCFQGAMEEYRGEGELNSILNSYRLAEQMQLRKYFPLTIFNTSTKESTVYYN